MNNNNNQYKDEEYENPQQQYQDADEKQYQDQLDNNNNNNNDLDSNNEQTNDPSLNFQKNQNFNENQDSQQQQDPIQRTEGYNEDQFQEQFPQYVNELIVEEIDRIQRQKSKTFGQDSSQPYPSEKEEISSSQQHNQQDKQQSPSIKSRQSTEFQASLNLFKSFIGAGIMGLPYAYMKSGYILAIIITILFNTIVYYSTCLVIDIGENLRRDKFTFLEVFEISLGKKAKNAFKLNLFFFQIGIGVAYVIFFTKFFEIVFWQARDTPTHRLLCLFMASLIIIPMILINTYHFFYKWSRVGNICAIIGLLGTFFYACHELNGKQAKNNAKNMFVFQQLPSLTGIVVCSFECVGHIQPIRNSMREPDKFRKIFKIGAVVVSSVYIIFSTFCVVALGKNLNQIVIMGIEKKYRYFTIIQAFYAVSLIFSYPLQLYPIYDVIKQNRYVKKWSDSDPKSKFRHYFPRFVITGIIFLIAYFVPKFSSFLNLLGASCGSVIQFVLPIIAYEVYYKTRISTKQKWFNRFILLIGVIGGIFAIIYSMRELTN